MSGSIDKTVKQFVMIGESGKYDYDKEFKYHEGFVYALHPCIEGNGYFSASKDMKVFHVDKDGNPSMLFEGHENAVNSISQSVPEEIVTGGWDGTARIWDSKTGKCKKVLEGHTHAVSVLSLPNGVIITGS